MLVRMWRKGNPFALLVGMQQIGSATTKSSMKLPQKIKNETSLWPSNPTSVNLSNETPNTNLKEYMHPYVHCSIIYNSQDLETAQVFISQWVEKTAMVHLHNGILLSHKKRKFYPETAWLDQGNIMLSEINQSEKDKSHMISLIYSI